MVALSIGSRPATAAGLRARRVAIPQEITGVSRKELSTAARDAGEALRLRPSMRLVLGELVGCYGEQKLDAGLIVWPQNAYLVRRTGLSERCVRSAVRDLVKLGVLAAIDSANGKRFCARAGDGTVVLAFGFSLSPLYARRYDFAAGVSAQRRESEAQSRRFDQITIARKAIEAVLEAMASHFPAVDIRPIVESLSDILARVPRRGSSAPIGGLVEELEALREIGEKLFLATASEHEDAASAGESCRHIESTKDRPIGSCRDFGEEGAELVRKACPAIEAYGERVGSLRDIERAGQNLRGALGAGVDAWHEAVDKLGLMSAALLVLLVFQLHTDDVASGQHRIRNPGGLYRSLVRRAAAGELDPNEELRALLRRRAN